MVSAISFGVFWRFAPSTRPIMRSRKLSPGFGGDADLDLVGEHARAAGDGAAVAAGFADDRRGFAGDGRFVHRRRAFDDLAVGGDELAGLDDDDIALAERLGSRPVRCVPSLTTIARTVWVRALRRASRLGLAAAFGHGFGEVGEEHREPEPERDLQHEAERRSCPPVKSSTVVTAAPTSVTNITGFFTMWRGLSFLNESPIAGTTIAGSKRE